MKVFKVVAISAVVSFLMFCILFLACSYAYLYYQKKHFIHRNDHSLESHLQAFLFNLNEVHVGYIYYDDVDKISISCESKEDSFDVFKNGKNLYKRIESGYEGIEFRVFFENKMVMNVYQPRLNKSLSWIYDFNFRKKHDTTYIKFKIHGPPSNYDIDFPDKLYRSDNN